MGNFLSTLVRRIGRVLPIGLVALAGLAFLKLVVFKKKKKNWSTSGQVPWNFSNPHGPGQGAALLAGVRVVEIASVFAAPSCSRVFADRMYAAVALA